MRPTRITLMLLALVAAFTLTTTAPVLAGAGAGAGAGGGGGGGSVCDGFSSGDHIRMHDNCFAGTAQLVDPDTGTLTVTNDGAMPHTITATDDRFDLYLDAGETATLDLPDDAVIPVYCTLHGTATGSGMAGVIVRDADTAPAAPAGITALGAPGSQDSGSDGLAVVAVIVAGVAAALAVAATMTAVAVRRADRVG